MPFILRISVCFAQRRVAVGMILIVSTLLSSIALAERFTLICRTWPIERPDLASDSTFVVDPEQQTVNGGHVDLPAVVNEREIKWTTAGNGMSTSTTIDRYSGVTQTIAYGIRPGPFVSAGACKKVTQRQF